ncbi:MAG: GumC family protein [Anaerolineales bacterium]
MTQETSYEDEIDLRQYIDVLMRNWWIVAVATLLAAAFGLIVSFSLTPTYEAAALVAFTESRYQIQFDPRFETVSLEPPGGQTLEAMATSDDMLQSVLSEVGGELPSSARTLDQFRRTITAEARPKSQVLELRASAATPDLAARIANLWAENFVVFANDLMSGASSELRFFEGQVVNAEAQLEAGEQALIDFESRNEAENLRSELDARRDLLSTYFGNENKFTVLIQNIDALIGHVQSLPPDSSPGLGEELAAIGLRIQAVDAASGVPVEIQLSESGSISNRTASEQAQYLEGLRVSVERRLQSIEALIEPLREDILSLQGQIGAVEAEQRRLTRDRDLASQVLVSLSNKLEEAAIEAENPQGEVRLASRAGVPSKPTSPRKRLNTIFAAALGAVAGVFVVFSRAWWVNVPEPKVEGEPASEHPADLATDR